jgi:hypothetical protein
LGVRARNPWRFSFDRQTKELYIADVGQDSYEEIDLQPTFSTGGENYGWRCKEGAHDFSMSGNCFTLTLKPPVYEYDHSQGCAIIGGLVYRGQKYPGMRGLYCYGDYCSGRIWGLKRKGSTWQIAPLLKTHYRMNTFGEDEVGNLYITDYDKGDIYMITEIVQHTTPTHNSGK